MLIKVVHLIIKQNFESVDLVRLALFLLNKKCEKSETPAKILRKCIEKGVGSLKKYFFLVFLVLVFELSVLFGISLFYDTNLVNTMFLGSCIFIIFAFLMSSTGDVLSKNTQVAVFDMLLGRYKPQHEKMTLKISPFLVGSVLCFGMYFVLYYLGLLN